MNKDLEPVFKTLLQGLEEAKIEYWVCGGVAVAAAVGQFFRPNGDEDISVKIEDFQNTKRVLKSLCENNLNLVADQISPIEKQKKYTVRIKNIPRLEVKYTDMKRKRLDLVKRELDNYRFTTQTNTIIKEDFIDYLKNRKSRSSIEKTILKIRCDGKMMLDPSEFKQYVLENPLWN